MLLLMLLLMLFLLLLLLLLLHHPAVTRAFQPPRCPFFTQPWPPLTLHQPPRCPVFTQSWLPSTYSQRPPSLRKRLRSTKLWVCQPCARWPCCPRTLNQVCGVGYGMGWRVGWGGVWGVEVGWGGGTAWAPEGRLGSQASQSGE